MHSLWIGTGRERDKAKWMRAHRDTRSRMRAAKNTWFQKKALEAGMGLYHHRRRELKNGKAGGESGILPEMLKAACESSEFFELLTELVEDVWRECKVPADWCDAVLIPIPKKGDLSRCDNWRGIALLDVVVARVLQERLQKVAEDDLPESQ